MKTVAYGYGVKGGRSKLWSHMIAIMLLALPAFSAQADPVRIVALGDSLVHGYGLEQDEGFVPQLQTWLDTQEIDAQVVNAGLSGDTTSGGLARLDWALGDDADALIVSLGGNDILRAISPEIARSNIEAILMKAEERGLPVMLIGIVVPPNYGAAYQADFEAIYPELSEAYETLYYPDFLGVFTTEGERFETYSRWFQRDGLHPTAEGVALVVEDMGPMVAELAAMAEPDLDG